MTKKKHPDGKASFTSFRIIGEKAHRLLERARELKKAGNGAEGVPLPEQDAHPEVIVHVSTGSVARAAFVVLAIAVGVLLVYVQQENLVLLLLAIFLSVVIDPGVRRLERMGMPRGLAVLIHYFVALFLLFFLLLSLIPIIAEQVIDLAGLIRTEVDTFLAHPRISLPLVPEALNDNLTVFLRNTLENLSIRRFTDAMQQVGQGLSASAQGSLLYAAQIAGSVVNFFVNLILVFVIAFFLQIEKEKIIVWLRGFLPRRFRTYVDDKSEVIHWKLAQWARGQLLLCLVIGSLVYLALTVLRMPYALTLAILAAFTEFIPVIGPFIAAVPAVMIAFTQQGFVWALILAGVYYVIQWCENNLIVPLIMKRAVGLSPVAIIVAMMVGISFPQVLHPVLGIMISIPATTIIALFLEDWRDARQQRRLSER